MIVYFLQGLTLGLSATATPGPFQAFLLAQTLKNGWKRTLPATLAPLVTDGPIIFLVLLVLTQTPGWFLNVLQIAGGLFVLYLECHRRSGSAKRLAAVTQPGLEFCRRFLWGTHWRLCSLYYFVRHSQSTWATS
ncbi:MAG: hypothetical protein HYR94_18055 [Chloroflexi bacterium]|nr:hypothetical protein [Chloroflexota bacterium]